MTAATSMLLGSDEMLGLLILFVENLKVLEITAIAVVTILLLVMADRTFTENVVVERSEINKVLNYYTTAFLIAISTVEVTQEGTLAYTDAMLRRINLFNCMLSFQIAFKDAPVAII